MILSKAKRLVSVLLLLFCTICCVPTCVASEETNSFVLEKCTDYKGSNIGAQQYVEVDQLPIHAGVINSYLSYDSETDKLIRFQSDVDEDGYLVETYSSNYELIGSRILARNKEYPLFGGYYRGENYQFILSGRTISDETAIYPLENPSEVNPEAILLLEQYDRQWNKINEVVISDVYTYEPFSSGNARFCELNGYLFIRTTHSFKLCPSGHEAGIRHQSSMMFQIAIDTMTVMDAQTEISNISTGYVSHSFNRFVTDDVSSLIVLEQGDCYPRSLVLIKYPIDASTGTFSISDMPCETIDIMSFEEQENYNYTGLSVGGIAVMDTCYVIPYSQTQTEKCNVSVSIVDKSSWEIQNIQLQKIEKQTTPHIVKCSEDLVAVLWQNGKNISYCFIDIKNPSDIDIFELKNANVSDCSPVLHNDRIIWYTYQNNKIWFHDISISNPIECRTTEIDNNHTYIPDFFAPVIDDYYEIVCKKCADRQKAPMTSSIVVKWSLQEYGEYTEVLPQQEFEAGMQIFFEISYGGTYDKVSPEVKTNSSLIKIEFDENLYRGSITFIAGGTHTIEFKDKYNPLLKEKFTLSSIGTVYGDINNNGEVDSMDYICIKRAYFGTFNLTPEQIIASDINKDGVLDSMDYVLCKRIYFGTYIVPVV